MHFEIFKKLGLLGWKWYFRVRATNGQIVAQSESYSRRIDAVSTIHSMRDLISTTTIHDRKRGFDHFS